MRAAAPRTWTVELRPFPQGPLLVCPHCSFRPTVQGRLARSAALAHLAQHARACPLPQHLRTCQCHERGCHWHPRHRGCAGPVLLVLAREHGGRLWRLTDACTACAHAMTHASVVPETRSASPPPRPAPSLAAGPLRQRDAGPAARRLTGEMLSYLASSLPGHTAPGARLVALQAILRADASSKVRLPRGLLRGILQGPAEHCWDDLVAAGLIAPHAPYEGWFTDPVLGMPGRVTRRRAADWALRTARDGRTRGLGPAGQLLTVYLRAHAFAPQCEGSADLAQLARLCGLSASALHLELGLLVEAGILICWSSTPTGEEIAWRLP
ncbi:hypothetical protein EDD98_7557 [Streptomyces sp. PanSC19]|nr:hypothetical protein EDD98_7557 [Streptomyces sp. PanSC19]